MPVFNEKECSKCGGEIKLIVAAAPDPRSNEISRLFDWYRCLGCGQEFRIERTGVIQARPSTAKRQ